MVVVVVEASAMMVVVVTCQGCGVMRLGKESKSVHLACDHGPCAALGDINPWFSISSFP